MKWNTPQCTRKRQQFQEMILNKCYIYLTLFHVKKKKICIAGPPADL